MLKPKIFQTTTLNRHPQGLAVQRILAAALEAVEPGKAVQKYLSEHPLPPAQRIFAFGLGKAALPMTRALSRQTALSGGLVITKHADDRPLAGVAVMEGGHPIPTAASLAAGRAALDFVSQLTPQDLLVCLISGGGSALMTAPRIPLPEMQELTSILLACGARVDEINTLRRALDQVKGGGLALAANGAQIISLILSDVVGNPLEAIASGPTVPGSKSNAAALGVLEKYGLMGKVPAGVLGALENSPDAAKAQPGRPVRVENVFVGSNLIAAESALRQAQSLGFSTRFLGDDWQGEAREVAKTLCEILKTAPEKRPFCLVAGGETTVTLHGAGRGGRNQELALAAVSELAGLRDVMLVTLATDGEDGPTDAAGAVVTGDTAQLGGEPGPFLARNDAYPYFAALGDLLKPGPSGTNVNDLAFLFGF
jgi:hydroxypyruvate reductase